MHAPLDDRVDRWLAQADADADVTKLVRERHPHLACFHAQQAAEKYVKALLTRLSGDAIPTHELERLVAACASLGADAPSAVRSSARSLDKYYVPTRYPDALGFADAALAYGAADVDVALTAADVVRAWCVQAIALARRQEPNPP
jgi:HEPN domain-containing protein